LGSGREPYQNGFLSEGLPQTTKGCNSLLQPAPMVPQHIYFILAIKLEHSFKKQLLGM